MDSQELLQLEEAAVSVMSPPYAVSEDARRKAETVFLNFRTSKLPYEACKYVLEHSQSEYVLFQAASTIREAVMREWMVLSDEDKGDLRGYVMHYLMCRPSLVSYVREQLLYSVALMVKRATLEVDRRKLFDSIFTTVSQLLTMDSKMQQLGCSLLSALLTEYSSSSGSSSIGLPLEFHIQCKKAIQGEELLRILLLTIQVLQRYLLVEWEALSKDDVTLFSNFLKVTSQVLNWDFHHSHFRPVFLTSMEAASVVLKPPKLYASTFLDASFVGLFFKLMAKVRTSEDHLHHVVQCLTQLASLTKPVFSTDEEQRSYVANFVAGILGYVSSSSDLNQQEMYGLSCVLRRLTTTFPMRHFAPLGAPQLELFIQSLAQLTCLSAHRAVKEEECKDDSLTYQESLEHYLEVWVCLLEGAESLPHDILTQPSTEIFRAYVQSKLSSPRGWRTVQKDEEEQFELVEDDRTAYKGQLCSIGYIARTVAGHSLPLLVSLLQQCTSECLHVYSLVQRDRHVLYTHQGNLDSVSEDIHWLTLIAGYTLCDIVQGEDVLIPAQLMRHSILHQSSVQTTHVNFSQLVWEEEGGRVDLSMAQLDPIVSLVLCVCRLCAVEKVFIDNGLMDVLSPQVCETTVWCLSGIAEPYLMLCEESYDQLSLPLLAAFGKDTESSRWLTAFLLEKVTFNLSVWAAEEDLALTSIQLLKSIVKSPGRAAASVCYDVLWSLMRSFSSGQSPLGTLPPSVQRELMGSLIMCGVGERKDQFLTELLQPFHQRFTSLVQQPDFHQDGGTQQTLLSILEAMCGLAQSARPDSVPGFFTYLLPLLQTAVSLLELYSDVPEVGRVILELFALVAENYTVFLSESHTTQLYEVSLALIQTYAKCNTGKYTKAALAEEEQCEDLLLFMRMLSHLTTKDYLDFGETTSNAVQPVDVIITGIGIILPLMSEEILKFPSLCQQFYTLIHYVCELFPDKLAVLPEKLYHSCMNLLEVGVTNYGSEICKSTLECIDSIAVHYVATPQLHTVQPLSQSLQNFMKVIFELMLTNSFDMDLIGPASGATFALICAQKEYYSTLASTLVTNQSDLHNHTRLLEAFTKLTPPSLSLKISRSSKIQFRKNLEEFLPFVKGFLCYR